MRALNWIFSIFCILCLPVFGFHIGTILMCMLGIASLPVRPIRERWENLPAHKVLRPLIIGILFLVFTCMIPTDNAEPDKLSEVSTETAVETAQVKSKEDETEKVETSLVEVKSETQAETEKVVAENKTQFQAETTEVTTENTESIAETKPSAVVSLSLGDIPAYSGKPYVEINNNVPQFLETDLSTSSYEYYSELDNLGRCGVVYACIGKDLMPTEERGEIGSVKPTGWHTVKYDVVDGKYLYNRCHLIGYQLSGENANTKNLITGTRYMNVEGMLLFENMVADYVKETGNHVMYRVSPIFEGNNLLAHGVQMEAQSVEDDGAGVLFNVFCYNVQPEVAIDYATGDSSCDTNLVEKAESTVTNATDNANTSNNENTTNNQADNQNASNNQGGVEEPINTSGSGSSVMVWISATGSKYHCINNCGRMNPNNAYQMTEEDAINQGYGKCSKCW